MCDYFYQTLKILKHLTHPQRQFPLALTFLPRRNARVRCQFDCCALNPWSVEQIAVTLNFYDITFTGYHASPAELTVEIPADLAKAAFKEYNSTIV
jgi:hypothetical protein